MPESAAVCEKEVRMKEQKNRYRKRYKKGERPGVRKKEKKQSVGVGMCVRLVPFYFFSAVFSAPYIFSAFTPLLRSRFGKAQRRCGIFPLFSFLRAGYTGFGLSLFFFFGKLLFTVQGKCTTGSP